MDESPTGPNAATLLGILSIVLWSTTIAFSRSLAEQLGTLSAAAGIYLLGGAAGCAYLLLGRGRIAAIRRLSAGYLLVCGSLFVGYTVCLYLAIGLASGRQQVIEVGIINYLWPSLTLVLSVPILHHRPRPTLPLGLAAATAGVVLAMLQGGAFRWSVLAENLNSNRLPYLAALIGAVLWGLYSNLSRRLGGRDGGGAVPVFILASGVLLAAMRLASPETSHVSARAVVELIFLSAGPCLTAYVCWDIAMRRGRIVLVASLSYLIPLLSTIITCAYLGVAMGVGLWLACFLVIGGAWLCNGSIVAR